MVYKSLIIKAAKFLGKAENELQGKFFYLHYNSVQYLNRAFSSRDQNSVY